MGGPRRKLNICLIAVLLTLVTSVAVLFTVPAFGRYASRVEQSFDLIIHPTKPIMAKQGTWYRGTTPAADIQMIVFAEANYLENHPGLAEEDGFVEQFNADVKNSGTVRCFVMEEAGMEGEDEELKLIISGNGYGSADTVYANSNPSGLFSAFTAVTEISGAEKLDTSAVTTFTNAFCGCSKLTGISGISQWNTERVTRLSSAFSGCSALTDLDLSGWDTSELTNLYYTFCNCNSLASLNLNGWATGEVNSMPGVFSGCASLTSLDLSGWVTDKVKELNHVFNGCTALTELDVSGWDTSNVTNLNSTFAFCTALQSLDLRRWDTAKVTNMTALFRADENLRSVTVSDSFVTSAVTESGYIFYNCTSLVGGHGTAFSAANRDDADYARIDTTNAPGYFTGTTVTVTFDPNGGTGSLPAQYVLPGAADTLVPENGTLSRSHFFFNGWNTAADGTGTAYADGGAVTLSADTTLYAAWESDEATFLPGADFNIAVKTLAGAASPTTDTADSTVTAIVRSNTAPADGTATVTVSASDSKRPITAWLDGTTLKYYTEAETVYLNANAGSMLRSFTALTSADTESWNTSRATDLSYLFAYTSALRSVNVSTWDTSDVTEFRYMFLHSGVTSLDLSSFDTSSAKVIGGMFESCHDLASVNVSSFDTSSVTNMICMFSGCSSLTSLNISSFTTGALTHCRGMFLGCTSLTEIYAVQAFDVSGLDDTDNMFLNCVSLAGGIGTPYGAGPTDGTYARIDTSSRPGYFSGTTKRIMFHSGLNPDTTRTQFVLPDRPDTLLPNIFTDATSTFASWNTAANGSGTSYADGAVLTRMTADPDVLHLYACWTERSYSVIMSIGNGTWTSTVLSPASRLHSEDYVLPDGTALSCTGFSFGGWYESPAFGGSPVTRIPAGTVEDRTVYAKWNENSYSVTYETNGGTWVSEPAATRTYTQSLTLPAAGTVTKTGYKLAGWYETADLSGTALSVIPGNTAGNKTLYAKWTPITYTVRFNANGGQANTARFLPAVTARYGEDFTLPVMGNKFVRAGYIFSGYDRSMSATFPTYLENGTARNLTTVDGATVTLYCIWSYDSSVWDTGANINTRLKALAGAGNLVHFARSATPPAEGTATALLSRSESAGKTYAWLDGTDTVKWYSPAAHIYLAADCSGMFSGLTALTDIDLEGVHCRNNRGYLTAYSTVQSISGMFSGCTSLVTAPMAEFDDLSSVADMSELFKGCTSLDGSGLGGMNTAAVTSMAEMFSGCTGLTALNLTNLNTVAVTDMRDMFSGCSGLFALNLTGIDTRAVTHSSGIFTGCVYLSRVTYSENYTLKTELPTPDSTYINGTDGRWHKSDGTGYTVADLPDHGTFYAVSRGSCATFVTGSAFNAAIKTLAAGTTTPYTAEDSSITAIVRSQTAPTGTLGTDYVCVSGSAPANDDTGYYDESIYAWFDSTTGELSYYSPADVLYMNENGSNMFRGLSRCASVDLSTIDTSHTKNMSLMFGQSYGLTSLDVSNFNTSHATNMYYMFAANNLQTIDVSGFDTSNVLTMEQMFYAAPYLTEIEGLDGFNTARVTNMSLMFSGCAALTSPDVTGFNTAAVTSMEKMFSGCTELTALDVTGFNTAAVTNMREMFSGCGKLAALDVTGFNTAAVTNMREMFSGCAALTALDVSHFNTAAVTNMQEMFSGCAALTALNLRSFNTAAVTTMEQMFCGCTDLASADVTSFDTANVTSMASMFSGCSSLTSVDVSGFSTANVTDMKQMFSSCSVLPGVDVSGFSTANVTDMNGMFNGCRALTALDVSGFITASVTDMSLMFASCIELTSLDLSSFNTENVMFMNSVFNGCTKLQTIYASRKFTVAPAASCNYLFNGCRALVGGNNTRFASTNVTGREYARLDIAGRPGYFTAAQATFCSGEDFNAVIKTLAAGTEKTADETDSTVTAILRSSDSPTGTTVRISSAGSVVAWLDGTTVYWDTNAGVTYFDADCAGMFKGFAALTQVDMGWGDEDVNTAYMTDVSELFSGCASLETFDFDGLDTSTVTDMHGMFKDCTGLTDVYMNETDTSAVTDMHSLFEGCTALVNLGIGDIRTGNVTDMSRMFMGCTALTRLNIWGFDTSGVTDCTDMFTGTDLHEVDVAAGMQGAVQTELFALKPWYTNLDLTQTYTTNLTAGTAVQVTAASQMTKGAFYDSGTVTTAAISDFNVPVKTLARAANGQGSAASTGVADTYILRIRRSMTPAPAGADTASLGTNVLAWFEDGTLWYYSGADQIGITAPAAFCRFNSVRSIDTSGLNTSGNTTMDVWFTASASGRMKRLDVSGFDTNLVTNMANIFSGCAGLEEIDVSGWNTANVTTLAGIFSGCSTLTALDLSGWNTACVTTLYQTFSGCSALTALDMSGWNTGSVTTLYQTFSGCSALTGLDLNGWNTGNVTTLYQTFNGCSALQSLSIGLWDTQRVTTFSHTFSGCGSLPALDIGTWNTSALLSLQGTFSACGSLTSLDLNLWNVSGVSTLNATFQNCAALTSLNIDRWDTSGVTTLYYAFYGCSSLISLDLHTTATSWNTSNVTILRSAFHGCSGLTSLNVSGWNTGSVSDMQSTFQSCSALTALDVSGWDTHSVSTLYQTFSDCTALTSVDPSGWNVSNVTTVAGIFKNCAALTSLDLRGWDTHGVINVQNAFYGMAALQTLNLHGWDVTHITSLASVFFNCGALTHLDLSGWEPSGVTSLASTFYGCQSLTELDIGDWDVSNVQYLTSTFYGCSTLTSIDLSGWDTSRVTNVSGMFYNCTHLEKIYVSDSFVTTAVTGSNSSNNMFYNCTSLAGESNTPYTGSQTNKTYARIDDPVNDRPGYFTRNLTFDISYYDYGFTGETEDYFLPAYQTGGANEADVPHTRSLARSVTLPTEDMLVVPEGMTLNGWLEYTDVGWSTEPIYSIAVGEHGVYVLTPNWVAANPPLAMSFGANGGALGLNKSLKVMQFGVSGGSMYRSAETED